MCSVRRGLRYPTHVQPVREFFYGGRPGIRAGGQTGAAQV
jgi:hypothetical protein